MGGSPRQGLADPSYSGTARPGEWETESARRKVAHRGPAGVVTPFVIVELGCWAVWGLDAGMLHRRLLVLQSTHPERFSCTRCGVPAVARVYPSRPIKGKSKLCTWQKKKHKAEVKLKFRPDVWGWAVVRREAHTL